jgi:hypothetical protein
LAVRFGILRQNVLKREGFKRHPVGVIGIKVVEFKKKVAGEPASIYIAFERPHEGDSVEGEAGIREHRRRVSGLFDYLDDGIRFRVKSRSFDATHYCLLLP